MVRVRERANDCKEAQLQQCIHIYTSVTKTRRGKGSGGGGYTCLSSLAFFSLSLFSLPPSLPPSLLLSLSLSLPAIFFRRQRYKHRRPASKPNLFFLGARKKSKKKIKERQKYKPRGAESSPPPEKKTVTLAYYVAQMR